MSGATETIRVAADAEDHQAFGEVIAAYVGWCRERCRDEALLVDRVFGHQALTTELADLAAVYGPPRGRTLLAWAGGEVCGGGAYRRLSDGSCEMKRLFVHDRFRGCGIGRRLCAALIEAARADGFALMRLDTGDRMAEAISLYASFGFVDAAPHHVYPDDLRPYLVFMELPLVGAAKT